MIQCERLMGVWTDAGESLSNETITIPKPYYLSALAGNKLPRNSHTSYGLYEHSPLASVAFVAATLESLLEAAATIPNIRQPSDTERNSRE